MEGKTAIYLTDREMIELHFHVNKSIEELKRHAGFRENSPRVKAIYQEEIDILENIKLELEKHKT